jgi:hypothetical protein
MSKKDFIEARNTFQKSLDIRFEMFGFAHESYSIISSNLAVALVCIYIYVYVYTYMNLCI